MNFRVLSKLSIPSAITAFHCLKENKALKAKSFEHPTQIREHSFDLNWDHKPAHESHRDVYLIRHGQYFTKETEADKKCLTDLGKQQASQTGIWLKQMDIVPTEFVHSTMIRAKQTAELVLAEMGENVSPDKISFTDLLCEGAPYMIEPVGHNKQYLSEKYARNLFDDGARIEAAYRNYIHRGDGNEEEVSIIVCHANVIRYFVMRAMQVDPAAWLRIGLNHGSVTKIRIFGNGDIRVFTLGESSFMPNDFVTSR